ncbi:uncharacterized protein EV420DRAFT_788562 [Desarmillaria tabescens]|uniref:Fungal-type protein kinase domain-containing protein n=1 Tax=Armillaria tabescens TaxID=1929756 RepID=A0AA39MVY5_ARMTA|nr:uncharacterized protein EV420DRAFT_788562 [Desarmillaria tabescens]KAK0449041.1 hypothetical protein EV420DRAFT_788562 [Desarmillaria tabescens]
MTTIPSSTPPKDTNNGTKVESTLQNRGTASRTMFNQYERAYLPAKVRSIEIDLKGRQKVEFVSLLKALLARMLLGESADGKDMVALDTAKSDADQLFDEMLEDAVNFCNSSLPTSAKTLPELSSSEIAVETKPKMQTSTRSETSETMKSHLKDFCQAKSRKQRSLPISTAINTIMVEYDGRPFGRLPCLDDHHRIIVIPNDPLVIESLQLRKDSPAAKRKPDNIIVQLSHLLKLDDTCKDSDYRSWVQSVETESEKCKWAQKGTDKKTSWLDVHCSIELDTHRVIESAPLDQPMSKDQVLGGTSSTPASDVLQSSDRKGEVERQLSSQPSSSSIGAASSCSCEKKRNHTEVEESETETTSSHKKRKTSDPDPPRFPAEIQCAYYAIERLRAAWNVTHSIVLLLEDNMLSLRWYDAEGCIVTQPIDIIGRLPLFVVMVIILQRFDATMWGFSDVQISQTTENGPVSFCLESDKAKGTRFQLVGRRTFGADVRSSDVATSHVLDSSGQSITPQGPHDASSNAPITTSVPPSPSSILKASNTPQKASSSFPVRQQSSQNAPSDLPGSTRKSHPLFFKAAWPENSQDREPQIIAEAISRANQYLGEFKAYVLEHVPTVVSWQEVKFTSTAIIRQLLGLPVERSRTLLWMVCHKLCPIEKCNGQDFWKGFWELIRCHYLLWCIGVAHGDISINNLMYDAVTKKAILNDFDLAALMDPGDVSPQKKGWERTGTQPFIALELLDKADGSVKRRYQHDLESFAWCLVWRAMDDTFPRETILGSTADAVAHKTSLGIGVWKKTAKPGFEGIWPCIVEWIRAWVGRSCSFMPALEDGGDFVREFADIVGKHEQAVPLNDPQLKVGRLSGSSTGTVVVEGREHGGCDCVVCIVVIVVRTF